MQIKVSKFFKKVASGFSISALLVFIILVFGSTQNEITGLTRNGAEALENIFYDLFFKGVTKDKSEDGLVNDKVSLENNSDPNIIIVDIDEPSLAKLGPYNEWDRSIHAGVVKHLNEGGASAISFDILLKNADFGSKKAGQVNKLLTNISPESNWDSLKPNIKAFFNYDSMLVSAIREGGNSIVCNMFDDAKSYKHESQWRPLSSTERVEEVGFGSVIKNSQVDSVNLIEPKELLDNIFPELAQAGAQMGSVNAYPDNDGVVRRVSMLYRFPSPELYPDDSSYIYSTMSLMTVLHLYGQKAENIKVKMGKYIDIGKPFGIYRDSSGSYHTTYPNFSYPMFLALRQKLLTKDIQRVASKDFVDVSSKIAVKKDKNEGLTLEIFEGQVLNEKMSDALLQINKKTLDEVRNNKSIELDESLTLAIDEEDDSGDRFLLTDSEDEEEAYINGYTVDAIQYFQDSIRNMPAGTIRHFSLDMDIRYDKSKKLWSSSQLILSDAVIRDIQKTPDEAINNLKPGEELRFGPVTRVPIDKHGQYQVNYKGHYRTSVGQRTFQHLSYYDVSNGRVDPSLYQGKIFILGSAAAALFDFVPGPHEENYPAVLIHATIIKNILDNDYIITLEEHKQQIIVILLALFSLLIGLSFKSNISVPISLATMGVYTAVAYHYFANGLYIGVSKQLSAMLLINITTLVVQFYFENKEKSFINSAFKQYISPDVIDSMVKNEIMPTLGGEKSNITAYFTDIASFSTFSEKIGDPRKLVDLLNEYLTDMTKTLLGNKGTLDKYEGDAIIAFFGAPMPLSNHAQSACDAAVDMQCKLMRLRNKWVEEGNKWPKVVHDMHMRIGINSGNIVTGNMGSTNRKNYTMMGDAVNLAARLESAAKQYGAYIQISEDTQKSLIDGWFVYRSLDTIRVVGKSLPVKTYELMGRTRRGEEITKLFISLKGNKKYKNIFENAEKKLSPEELKTLSFTFQDNISTEEISFVLNRNLSADEEKTLLRQKLSIEELFEITCQKFITSEQEKLESFIRNKILDYIHNKFTEKSIDEKQSTEDLLNIVKGKYEEQYIIFTDEKNSRLLHIKATKIDDKNEEKLFTYEAVKYLLIKNRLLTPKEENEIWKEAADILFKQCTFIKDRDKCIDIVKNKLTADEFSVLQSDPTKLFVNENDKRKDDSEKKKMVERWLNSLDAATREAGLLQLVEIWKRARKCYLNMEWDKAIELFTQCLELEPHHPDRDPGSKTTPSHVYIKRCEAYKLHPPVAEGETWDGVFTATEK